MDKKDKIGQPQEKTSATGRRGPGRAAGAKDPSDINKLCLSCRRACKQGSAVLIASCPRYYQGPKIKREDWKQMALPLADDAESHAAQKTQRPRKKGKP